MKLPPQGWMEMAGADRILGALDAAAGRTRLVGGAVRDALLGLDVTDVDLATAFPPAEVIRRLHAADVKAIPTGIAHGTVTAVAPDIRIEITTLRRDVATDGRRAEVAFTDDWRADAARRDFTFNALFARLPGGEIDDFFGGRADLAARRVRFIGEPLKRIAEDHLRILRFFRFHARFGAGEPDAAAIEACTQRARDLMALSRERIRDEVLKIAGLPDPSATIALMVERGIFLPVLPEIEAEGVSRFRHLVGIEAALATAPDPVRHLAGLLPPNPEIAAAVGARLRLSNRDRARLAAAAEPLAPVPGDLRPLAYRQGLEVAADRALLSAPDAAAAAASLASLNGWERPALPLSGRHLIARGLTPGPNVSRALAMFEASWIAAGFPQEASVLDRMADEAVGAFKTAP